MLSDSFDEIWSSEETYYASFSSNPITDIIIFTICLDTDETIGCDEYKLYWPSVPPYSTPHLHVLIHLFTITNFIFPGHLQSSSLETFTISP